MSNEVTTKETTAVAVPQTNWGMEKISSSDMIIPRIQVLQLTSKMLQKDGLNAKPSELRGSLEGNLLGGKEKPVKVVPIYLFNSWIKLDTNGNKFLGTVPRDHTNEGLPQETVENGKKIKNMKAINMYCLLASDISAGTPFPYLVTFQGTGFTTGKKLVTLVTKLKMFGKPLASKFFSLGVEPRENEKGKWFIFSIDQNEDVALEHQKIAYDWYKLVTQTEVKVDDSEFEEAQVVAAAGPEMF